MKWYAGTVESAIQKALNEEKIFIVYIQGDDESSKKMDVTWNCKEVALLCTEQNCTAIRIKTGSVEVEQFSKFYPVLCVPSTYFINQSGVPIDIVGGYMEPDSFVKRIQGSLKREDATDAAGMPSPIQTTVADAGSELPLPGTSTQNVQPSQDADLPNPVASAKELIKKRRQEKEEQDLQDKIEKEKKRRENGRNVETMKQKQKDEEARKLVRDLALEKTEAKAAREAIRKKIMQDKMEKAAKFEAAQQTEQQKKNDLKNERAQAQAVKLETANSERLVSRIQFRLPDGSSINREFSSDTTLRNVMKSFMEETEPRFGSVQFATVYPKRQFNEGDMDSAIKNLNLTPSAVLIVLPAKQITSSSSSSGVLDFLKFVLAPFLSLLMYLKVFIWGTESTNASSGGEASTRQTKNNTNTPNPPKNAAGSQDSSTYKKSGNIHKFKQDDDDDDENKTWNGNSTQQL